MFHHLVLCWLVAAGFAIAQYSSWIDEQYNSSLTQLLDNIFENGTVIASPSRKDPDYYVRSLILSN